MRRGPRQDPLPAHRLRVFAVAASLFSLLFLFFYVTPRLGRYAGPFSETSRKTVPGGVPWRRYAVIFDAGSSGSRVHVYCFDRALDLVPIGKELELFSQIKPGLSAYARNPKGAAESLSDLLAEAENVVPSELWHKTPVKVGATAGLRTLGAQTSEKILEEVRNILSQRGSFMFKSDWVTVLDGMQEGAFQWVTINYLLGNLGKDYSETVGIVDLGGGSVQMAYAISKKAAADAPKVSDSEEAYVKELYLKGSKYYLYVHSYLHYGLLAARAEVLRTDDDAGGSCILAGHHGSYKYGDTDYPASSSAEGPSYTKCREAAVKALKVDEPACTHMKCTFGGVWNGGGGDGQKKLLVASFFFDRALEVGFVKPDVLFAKVKPDDYKEAAKQACEISLKDARAKYPRVEEDNLPYLCLDLVYQFTLLVDGFGLDSMQDIILVKQIRYGDSYVEAAWPLGSAIEAASSA